MKIHHIRNATLVIETAQYGILVDPMLGAKGSLPPFSLFRHKARKNPMVELPDSWEGLCYKGDTLSTYTLTSRSPRPCSRAFFDAA